MACHSISGIGSLGGGALGPDLSQSYEKFKEAGIEGILSAPPFPTMKPIYDKHPLTPEEQAHVKAFLQTAVAKRSTGGVAQLSFFGFMGFLLLIGGGQMIWSNRTMSVRRAMVEKASRIRRDVA